MNMSTRIGLIILTIGLFAFSCHSNLELKENWVKIKKSPTGLGTLSEQAKSLMSYFPAVVLDTKNNFINVIVDENIIQFEFNSFFLDDLAKNRLIPLSNILLANNKITISGYTCSLGDDNYNLYLSEKRAESVKEFIQAQKSSINNIITYGYGKMYPIANNYTEEGRRKNRRVEVKIEMDEDNYPISSKDQNAKTSDKGGGLNDFLKRNNQIIMLISFVASIIQIIDFILRYIFK